MPCRDRVVLLALVFFSLLPSVGKAGQGGLITLVNGTPYNWRSSDLSSYQMDSWGFPEVITAGSTATLYVEWSQGFLENEKHDYGVVTFSLEGTGLSFRLEATAATGFNLHVLLTNLSTLGNPKGGTIDLGWKHNGFVNFILAGRVGSFTSSRPPSAWMQENLGVLGDRNLRNLCIPGSHDAGMGKFKSGTIGAFPCNTVTQTLEIGRQLQAGIRYFDIRPVISGNRFYTGHYSYVPELASWQGANGQPMESIIKDVNSYTKMYKELVVLHLSHDLNTDFTWPDPYRPFTQGEWCRLLSELKGLNALFAVANPGTVDLTTLRLKDFIGKGAAVVVVVQPASPSLALDRLGCSVPAGFYAPRSFPVLDQYTGTNDLGLMQQDQLTKLHLQRPSPDAGYFLLSWTLTQNKDQAIQCIWPKPFADPSILDLADQANPALYQSLLPVSNRLTYPNILYIDKAESPDIAALAMAVNSKASWDKPRGVVIYKGLDSGIFVSYGRNVTRMNPAINTSDTPGAVTLAGGLYVLYKGAGTDSRIYLAHSVGGNILAGEFWNAEPLKAEITTSTAPGVAVLNNTLYMLYKGAGGDANIYIACGTQVVNGKKECFVGKAGDGNSWSASRLNAGINTSAAPAVAAFKGSLYLFYKGAGGDANIYVARSSGDVLDGNTWTFARLNPTINTSAAPGVVAYNGDLYMFYKGSGADTSIYVARSTGGNLLNGGSWTFARLNPGINTSAAPKPLVVGDSLYLLYKGLENRIWLAKPQGADVFNGNAWQWEPLDPSINTSTGPGAAAM